MGEAEKIFRKSKNELPYAFRDGVPPCPPRKGKREGSIRGEPIIEKSIIPIGSRPGFNDPERIHEPFELPKPDERIYEQLAESGWEAIAWYLPFHLNEREWGVYVHWNRFGALAACLTQKTRAHPYVVMGVLWDELMDHELFHFRTEFFATIAEGIAQKPFYLNYNQKYQDLWGTPDCVEEALATSHSLRRKTGSIYGEAVKQELESIADKMPDGYKQWRQYIETKRWHGGWWQGIAKLTLQVLNHSNPDATAAWVATVHNIPKGILPSVPRYVWLESGTSAQSLEGVMSFLITTKQMCEFLRQFYPNYQIEFVNERLGKHPIKLVINGKRIPISTNWDGIPPFVFNQIAGALGVETTYLRREFTKWASRK